MSCTTQTGLYPTGESLANAINNAIAQCDSDLALYVVCDYNTITSHFAFQFSPQKVIFHQKLTRFFNFRGYVFGRAGRWGTKGLLGSLPVSVPGKVPLGDAAGGERRRGPIAERSQALAAHGMGAQGPGAARRTPVPPARRRGGGGRRRNLGLVRRSGRRHGLEYDNAPARRRGGRGVCGG